MQHDLTREVTLLRDGSLWIADDSGDVTPTPGQPRGLFVGECRLVSRWELTETYSPAAIDMAPATRAAPPAIRISVRPWAAAATPTIRLAVETMPSLAPSTAARS